MAVSIDKIIQKWVRNGMNNELEMMCKEAVIAWRKGA